VVNATAAMHLPRDNPDHTRPRGLSLGSATYRNVESGVASAYVSSQKYAHISG